MNAPAKIEAGHRTAHARLADARVELHASGLKKSGSAPNRRGGFFELGDFIVPSQIALRNNGLVGVVSYPDGKAVMEIVNLDDSSDRIIIESPLGSARLPNCHEVQNIGAVQTYQRRYLWMTAMEIVEHDALEGSEVAKESVASREQSQGGAVSRETPADYTPLEPHVEDAAPKHDARKNPWSKFYSGKSALHKGLTVHQAELIRLGNEGTFDDLEGYLTSPEYADFVKVAGEHAPHYLEGGEPAPEEFVGCFKLEQRARDMIALRGNQPAEMEGA